MRYSSWDSFAIKHQLVMFGWDTSLLPTWPGRGFEVDKVRRSAWAALLEKVQNGVTGVARWSAGKSILIVPLF